MNSSSMFKIIIDETLLREITREEVGKLLKDSIEGTWWDMKRLELETSRKRDWLIGNILLNPLFKEEMNFITNGCEGGRWLIRASEMKSFLNANFHLLNREKKKEPKLRQ